MRIISSSKLASLIFSLAFVWLISAPPVAAQMNVKRAVKCTGATDLPRTEIAEILSVHNQVRAELKLAPLQWDCKLADYAQQWADRGVAEHREDSDFGESIFVAASNDIAAVSAVNKWMLERSNWNNASGTCSPGKTCTHYTQIVWKKTARIGCGINRNAPGKWKTMIVCNYDPAGNKPGPAF